MIELLVVVVPLRGIVLEPVSVLAETVVLAVHYKPQEKACNIIRRLQEEGHECSPFTERLRWCGKTRLYARICAQATSTPCETQ